MALKDKTEAMQNRIYRFAPDMLDWTSPDKALAKKLLGGKGASLVSMIEAGLPVPPGFTITTESATSTAQLEQRAERRSILDNLMIEVLVRACAGSQEQFGFMPLVSVRSGAPVSMPGMMDTILNVGLNDKTILPEWAERIGERAALDSYRRLIQMLGATAYGVPKEMFEAAARAEEGRAAVEHDTELDDDQLKDLVDQFERAFEAAPGTQFPQIRYDQLRAAIRAVFDSWMNERAIDYRKLNKIDESMGTAVNVQAMVFGNMNDDSRARACCSPATR